MKIKIPESNKKVSQKNGWFVLPGIIKTSKERLKKCGWEFIKDDTFPSRFTTKVDDVKVIISVVPSTYELFYIEVSSNKNKHTVFDPSQILPLMDKIKELEIN